MNPSPYFQTVKIGGNVFKQFKYKGEIYVCSEQAVLGSDEVLSLQMQLNLTVPQIYDLKGAATFLNTELPNEELIELCRVRSVISGKLIEKIDDKEILLSLFQAGVTNAFNYIKNANFSLIKQYLIRTPTNLASYEYDFTDEQKEEIIKCVNGSTSVFLTNDIHAIARDMKFSDVTVLKENLKQLTQEDLATIFTSETCFSKYVHLLDDEACLKLAEQIGEKFLYDLQSSKPIFRDLYFKYCKRLAYQIHGYLTYEETLESVKAGYVGAVKKSYGLTQEQLFELVKIDSYAVNYIINPSDEIVDYIYKNHFRKEIFSIKKVDFFKADDKVLNDILTNSYSEDYYMWISAWYRETGNHIKGIPNKVDVEE